MSIALYTLGPEEKEYIIQNLRSYLTGKIVCVNGTSESGNVKKDGNGMTRNPHIYTHKRNL